MELIINIASTRNSFGALPRVNGGNGRQSDGLARLLMSFFVSMTSMDEIAYDLFAEYDTDRRGS